jgi:hypothetical protein
MRFANEEEMQRVIEDFEDATINRDSWKHAEHLTVALHYLQLYDIETATAKMRTGIFNLLEAFGVDLKREMPYHETLTIFWMRAVAEFDATRGEDPLLTKANDLVLAYDKDHPLKFYSRELLFSDQARGAWVEPDLTSGPHLDRETSTAVRVQ